MARYDVYQNSHGSGYMLDVQTDLLYGLNTRVVVPLLPEAESPRPARRLNPIFEIQGQQTVMVTQFMAAVPVTELKKVAGNLGGHHDQISEALDMLFKGF